jgi:hypothetical protein
MDSSLCSLPGRYDNPVPTRFLSPIDCYKKILAVTVGKTVLNKTSNTLMVIDNDDICLLFYYKIYIMVCIQSFFRQEMGNR